MGDNSQGDISATTNPSDLNKLSKLDVSYKSRTREVSPHTKTVKELFEMTIGESSFIDKRIANSKLMQSYHPSIMAPSVKYRSTSNAGSLHATSVNQRSFAASNANTIFTEKKKKKKLPIESSRLIQIDDSIPSTPSHKEKGPLILNEEESMQ